ncbi:hypothetical protein [Roseibium aggregatum]|uniref:Uncharacterized protein n=1 Tax=Roseibium aggregatum TaxID=187304 RepID=A0A926NXP1_9HYPH|nr:hypothetical protein [Roseibium aggregatum]MBD1549297.1 hypothetical protein [Roseibium aggregatum]
MTAEVAIINRSGIALAADSAVTIGRDRVWKNSNKLFHLAPANDVGVMFFGSGDYCGLPWEVVLKEFRKKIGKTTFPLVTDYVDNFLIFLDDLVVPDTPLKDLNRLFLFLNAINECKKAMTEKGTLKRRAQLVAKIEELSEEAENIPILFDGYTRDQFRKKHSKDIKQFMEEELEMHVTKGMHSHMITLCFERARRAFKSPTETGVVFAGYGDKELLPVVVQLCVDGELDEKVRAWQVQEENMNTGETSSAILPFAQADIATLFVEGTLPQNIRFTEKTLLGALDKKTDDLVDDYVPDAEKVVERARQKRANRAMVKEFTKNFKEFRNSEFIDNLMRVVNSLPKEEMAAMAEALVEITSLRRKMDSKLETVAGPVDVAIVSKSDGFVWIKRKHYFDIALNRDFVERRSEKYQGEIDNA